MTNSCGDLPLRNYSLTQMTNRLLYTFSCSVTNLENLVYIILQKFNVSDWDTDWQYVLHWCKPVVATSWNCHMVSNTIRGATLFLGNLNFVRLNWMGVMNRLSGHGMYKYIPGFNSNMFGRHWQFTPALYSRAAVEFPMAMNTWLGGYGKTSIDLCQSIVESATGELLASGVFRIVNVDPKTQAAAALPDGLRETLSKITLGKADKRFPLVKPPTSIPDKSFSCKVTVRYDDMDFYFHSTQGAYLGFARECAAQASTAGYYTRLKDDIAFHLACETTGVHFGESFAGDQLQVSTWEDSQCPLLLHFTVSKEHCIIYYATVRYFDVSWIRLEILLLLCLVSHTVIFRTNGDRAYLLIYALNHYQIKYQNNPRFCSFHIVNYFLSSHYILLFSFVILQPFSYIQLFNRGTSRKCKISTIAW